MKASSEHVAEAPRHRALADNDDAAEGADAEIRFVAPADGARAIAAKTLLHGETGGYVIGLSRSSR